jgi:diguanylate cyclase (GGDEF)-like protein
VARIGGEEFAVVLPETGRFQAAAIAERLRERISQSPFLSSTRSLSVTASFGFCSLRSAATMTPGLKDSVLLAADAALYDSKRSGRNRVTEGPEITGAKPVDASAPAKQMGPGAHS